MKVKQSTITKTSNVLNRLRHRRPCIYNCISVSQYFECIVAAEYFSTEQCIFNGKWQNESLPPVCHCHNDVHSIKWTQPTAILSIEEVLSLPMEYGLGSAAICYSANLHWSRIQTPAYTARPRTL